MFKEMQMVSNVLNARTSHLTSHIPHATSHISHATSHMPHLTSHISHLTPSNHSFKYGERLAVVFLGLQVEIRCDDRFALGGAFGKDVAVRRDDKGCACERHFANLGGVVFAYGVDGGDIDLVFDGSCLEERFPVGTPLGGPSRLDGNEVRPCLIASRNSSGKRKS